MRINSFSRLAIVVLVSVLLGFLGQATESLINRNIKQGAKTPMAIKK